MNRFALDGLDRCECGCKYWEYDRCVDCGTYIRAALALDVADAKADYEDATIEQLSDRQETLKTARARLNRLDKELLRG